MKGHYDSMRNRRGLGSVAFFVIGAVIIVGVAAVAIELAGTRPTTTSSHGPVAAVAKWIDPAGNQLTNETLKIGDRIKVGVTVTEGTQPIAVHLVYKGNVYRDHPWDVNATKYDYFIDWRAADATDLGVDVAYAVVSFQDGTLVQSNNVTLTVTR